MLGDLHKSEIVFYLKKAGITVIKSVRALNLVLQEMGVQRHSGDHWVTTKEGVSRTIYKMEVCDPDAWHPSIVNEIIDYLKQKEHN